MFHANRSLNQRKIVLLYTRGELCEEAALRNDRLATQVPDRGLGVDGDRIVARREEYIRRALEAIVPRPAQNIYR